MSRRILVPLAALAAALFAAAPARAADAPALKIVPLTSPTNFVPGDEAHGYAYDVRVYNMGAAVTDGSDITITDTLPTGVTVKSVSMPLRRLADPGAPFDSSSTGCEVKTSGKIQTVVCTISASLPEVVEPALLQPGEERKVVIHVVPKDVEEGETLTNHVAVEGGGSEPAEAESHNKASAEPTAGGIAFWNAELTEADGKPSRGAGSHPYQLTTTFAVNTEPGPEGASSAAFVPAGGDIKDIRVPLPPGLVGNPNAVARCTAEEFSTVHTIFIPPSGFFTANACPDKSVVGLAIVQQIEGNTGYIPVPVYNLVPPPGMPAQFGAQILNLPFYIDAEVRPDEGYKIVGTLRNTTQVKRLTAASLVLWGTPTDKRHDPLRGTCLNQLEFFPITAPECDPLNTADPKPFLRLPTNCVSPLDFGFGFDTWTTPNQSVATTSPGLVPLGCNQLEFEPTLQARPTTDVADSPTGLHVHLHIPQKANEQDPEGRGEADLREVSVAFPKGLVANPAGANGLDACTAAQVGLTSGANAPAAFDAAPAHCPDAARLGLVEVNTPLLDHPLKGSVYAATPYQNPFGSLLAIYIAVDDPLSGVVIKLAGKVSLDPVTGQLTGTFAENPQAPFEDFELEFFGGSFAALRTPAVCGSYATTSTLTPWSAPESGPPVVYVDGYAISKPPDPGSCPTTESDLPFSPSFDAGAVAPIAHAYTPFVLHLSRKDGTQELSGLTMTLPPGVIAKLRGVACCPESALAAAAIKSGREEQLSPSCPPASRVGSVTAGVGAGPAPYYASGLAYLACSPYKGAPLSVAIVTPAAAGPYDLGTIVVRTALYIDPETFQVTAKSDPIPHILQGIPVDLRTVAVKLDRPEFTLNPTSCDPMQVSATAFSTLGRSAALSSRFQVGECGRLKFAPKVSLRLRGSTVRGGHPGLRTVITYPKGDYANIARASVALPHSEFLDSTHIGTVCTRVQFAAHACPPASVYGYAKATSPLVDYTVEGPAYLRSSNHPLPDLVLALHGPPSQPVEAAVVARIDSVHGGTRATVDAAPDVPISKFTLTMPGGKKGLFVNSRNICATVNRASVKLDAQNGKVSDSQPVLKATCHKHKRGGKKHRRG